MPELPRYKSMAQPEGTWGAALTATGGLILAVGTSLDWPDELTGAIVLFVVAWGRAVVGYLLPDPRKRRRRARRKPAVPPPATAR